jgi:hypothetical protein
MIKKEDLVKVPIFRRKGYVDGSKAYLLGFCRKCNYFYQDGNVFTDIDGVEEQLEVFDNRVKIRKENCGKTVFISLNSIKVMVKDIIPLPEDAVGFKELLRYYITPTGDMYGFTTSKPYGYKIKHAAKRRLRRTITTRTTDKDGNTRVLQYDKYETWRPHELLVMAFICHDYMPETHDIHFIDGDSTNLSLDNLEVTEKMQWLA